MDLKFYVLGLNTNFLYDHTDFAKDYEYIHSIGSFVHESSAASMHNVIRHKQPNVLPTFENAEDDMDSLDDVSTNLNVTTFH
jgi:hypothetical protein